MAAKDSTKDPAAAEVQKNLDVETEQGFRGAKVDPTPNENYTAEGVSSGAPTPETDPKLAAEVASIAATRFDPTNANNPAAK